MRVEGWEGGSLGVLGWDGMGVVREVIGGLIGMGVYDVGSVGIETTSFNSLLFSGTVSVDNTLAELFVVRFASNFWECVLGLGVI